MDARDNQADVELVARIKAGDEAAFATLFRQHAAALNDFAYSLLKSRDAAEDVVQDVFVRIWDKRNSLNIQQSISVYLYRAIRNSSLDKIKHEQITQRHILSEAELHSGISNADSILENEELLKALDSAIDDLPERAGDVLRLRIEHGLSNAEIAGVMGISVKGVERARWRALEALRRILKDHLL